MGKFENVPELTGQENYYEWRCQTENLLIGEGVYNHISRGTDPLKFIEFASYMPQPESSSFPTESELAAIKAWAKEDGLARSIIMRKLSPSILAMVPESASLPARDIWEFLAGYFDREDVPLQFAVRGQLETLRMKGADDADKYVQAHIHANARLARMGAPLGNRDAIYLLLRGLPATGPWPFIRRSIEMRIQQRSSTRSSHSASSFVAPRFPVVETPEVTPHATGMQPPASPAASFYSHSNPFRVPPAPEYTLHNAGSEVLREALQIRMERPAPGPGSEFANSATERVRTGDLNAETGLRKTKNNPSGTYCTTQKCSARRRSDHDTPNCYQEGGGRAGQAPWQQGNKGGRSTKGDAVATAAVAQPIASSGSGSVPVGGTAAAAIAGVPTDAHFRQLSCALVGDDSSGFGLSAATASGAIATILDSGTTSHLIRDRSLFLDYHPGSVVMQTANQGTLRTLGKGTCLRVALLRLGGRTVQLRLENCLHSPDAVANLISVGRMVDKGWELRFRGGPSRCQLLHDGAHLGDAVMLGNICHLDIEFLQPSSSPAPSAAGPEMVAFVPAPLSLDLWHARLGHAGGDISRHLRHSAPASVKVVSSAAQSRCEACITAKHPRLPHPPSSSPSARRFLELVHSDVCGPFPVETIHRKRYFVLFLDDHTNVIQVHLLSSKDQVFEAWKLTCVRWEARFSAHVRSLQTDNGGEYVGQEFLQHLLESGVEHRRSVPYAHQQNGKAERAVRTLEGRALALLHQARLSAGYFGEAVLCAAYLWNLSSSRAVLPGEKTPFEMLHGHPPDLSHLRVFGSRCFARIPPEVRVKNGPHSQEAIFMGYPDGVKGWRLRGVHGGAFFNSRDVIFDEDSVLSPPRSGSESLRIRPPSPAPPVESDSLRVPSPVVSAADTGSGGALPSSPGSSPLPELTPSPIAPRRSQRVTLPTERGRAYLRDLDLQRTRLADLRTARAARVAGEGASASENSDSDAASVLNPSEEGEEAIPLQQTNLIITEQANLSIRSDKKRNPCTPGYDMLIPPATYDEAVKRSDASGWKEAMAKELATMREMKVWDLVEPPAGRKLIGNRWVFEFKPIDLKGGSPFKARLVAQGFSQVPGVDFHQLETYAPVAKQASIRLLIALAAKYDWELDCFDAKRAFLHGKLKEEVYMKQPRGFEQYGKGGVQLACKPQQSLYGLKQAALDWYELLSAVLCDMGFTKTMPDLAVRVFIYDRRGDDRSGVVCIIAWHVDDGLGGCNDRGFLNQVKGRIKDRFGLSDMGAVSMYLGIEIERDRAGKQVWVHQGEYIAHLCREYGLEESHCVSIPMDPNHPFGRAEDKHSPVDDLGHSYRKLIGELLYISTCTRADISHAVQTLARHCASPELRHFGAARRILRYLKGTSSLRLHFGNPSVSHESAAFCDSDWAGCPVDRISVSGYVWLFYGAPVIHVSKKQATHALSSTEAEYLALSACIQDGLWLIQMLSALRENPILPLQVFANNAGAISLASAAYNHNRLRHMDVRVRFIEEHVQRGAFKLTWVPSAGNLADILTKPLPRPSFTQHRIGLSLVPR